MKKVLLFATALVATMAASAQGSVNIGVVASAEQDYLFYASPNDVEGDDNKVQKIVTGADYIWSSPTYRMQHFLVECLASPTDFQKGVTSGVTPLNNATLVPTLPGRAKISGLALPGWRHSGLGVDLVYNLNAFLYLKNLTAEEATAGTLPYKNTMYAEYKRILDNADNGYVAVIPEANKQFCPIDEASAENPYCVKLTFDKPYEYLGDYINLAIDLIPANDNGVESSSSNYYGAVFDFPLTKATENLATVYHTMRKGGTLETEFTFFDGCEQDIFDMIASNFILSYYLSTEKVQALLNYFNFQGSTLPAFQLTYFTNDIKGSVLDEEGKPIVEDVLGDDVDTDLQPNGRPLVSLYDMTDQSYIAPDGTETLNALNAAEVAADGSFSFSNLDHTHQYTLQAMSATCGSQTVNLNFDQGLLAEVVDGGRAEGDFDAANAIKNDLVCNIVMKQDEPIHTGVSQIDSKAQAVSVTYYNVAGISSRNPFSGVNMVVTRYSDGSVKTTKAVY